MTTLNHAERQTRLHATDVASIMGLNSRRTAHTVWLEKTGRLEPWAGNEATGPTCRHRDGRRLVRQCRGSTNPEQAERRAAG